MKMYINALLLIFACSFLKISIYTHKKLRNIFVVIVIKIKEKDLILAKNMSLIL